MYALAIIGVAVVYFYWDLVWNKPNDRRALEMVIDDERYGNPFTGEQERDEAEFQKRDFVMAPYTGTPLATLRRHDRKQYNSVVPVRDKTAELTQRLAEDHDSRLHFRALTIKPHNNWMGLAKPDPLNTSELSYRQDVHDQLQRTSDRQL